MARVLSDIDPEPSAEEATAKPAKDSPRPSKARRVLSEGFEFLWLVFTVLLLKDWLLSGVDDYPYRQQAAMSIAVCLATVVVLGRRTWNARLMVLSSAAAAAIAWLSRPMAPSDLFAPAIGIAGLGVSVFLFASSLRWRLVSGAVVLLSAVAAFKAGASAGACVPLAVVCVGAIIGRMTLGRQNAVAKVARVMLVLYVAVFTAGFLASAGELRHLPWTSETSLGVGFGSQTLPTSFLAGLVDLPDFHPSTGVGIIAYEEGLPAVVALALLVLAAAMLVAAGRRQDAAERGRKRDAVAVGGVAALAGLLFIAQSQPAFLTLTTPLGTCVLIGALACAVFALPESAPTAAPARRVPAGAVWLSIVILVAAVGVSGALIEGRLHQMVGPLASGGPAKGRVDFVPLTAVSQTMQDATVAMEDHNFYRHHGIDPEAVHRALRFDLRLGEIKQGGSTITQQLAKNLFLTNDRTLGRKLEEAALALEIEHMLTKRRILELYVNTIDYGMGQHGIDAASRYYFHIAPAQLDLPQSAILVGMVPDPMHVQLDPDRVTKGMQTALGRIAFFFPNSYSQTECDNAGSVPLTRLLYPDKDAWDRGATDEIPAQWHGVSFYFFADPGEAASIPQAASSLKQRLASFDDDAKRLYHVVGIDHLGVYNDRPTRQNERVVSAHAFGQAIDISGFRFADGSRIKVSDHTNPAVARRLAPLEALLKKHFDIVVDWREDPVRHETHFHSEVKGPRSSEPRDPFPQPLDQAAVRSAIASDPGATAQMRTWCSGAVLHQQTDHTCGQACVATILSKYLDRPATEMEIVRDTRASGDLASALQRRGVAAHTGTFDLSRLESLVDPPGPPAIVSFSQPYGHYVMLVGVWHGDLLISDPLRGNYAMAPDDFLDRWGGVDGEADHGSAILVARK